MNFFFQPLQREYNIQGQVSQYLLPHYSLFCSLPSVKEGAFGTKFLTVMPWRSKTLTQFRTGQPGSVVQDACGEEQESEWVDVADVSNLFGKAVMDFSDAESSAGVCTSFEPGVECSSGWLQAADKSGPEFKSSASTLGATHVPRGSVFSDSTFSHLVASSFVRNMKPEKVKMPWDKGVARLIFDKQPFAAVSNKTQFNRWVERENPGELQAGPLAGPFGHCS